MEDALFNFLFLATAAYLILGIYLYFSKVLPALDEPPKFLPTGQLDDVDRYLQILDETGQSRWFKPILRNARKIILALLIGYMIFLALFDVGIV